MNASDIMRLSIAVARCGLMMHGLGKQLPYRVNVIVTHACNSRCRTCDIWKLYHEQPDLRQEELTLEEFERLFKSLPQLLWVNFSGGEPTLRDDLAEIIGVAANNCRLIGAEMSTNGLLPDRVEKITREILEKTKIPHLALGVSIDGPLELHESIRGVPGGWNKSVETYRRLLELSSHYKNLSVHLNYVLSGLNIGHLDEYFEAFKRQGLDVKPADVSISIAHTDGKLFLFDKPHLEIKIPGIEAAKKDLDLLTESRRFLLSTNLTQLRPVYKRIFHSLAMRHLRNPGKMVIPCAAMFAQCFIDPYGTVYSCALWGVRVGNLKETGFDFNKIWFSEIAAKLRRNIRVGACQKCWNGCESWGSILQQMPWVLRFMYSK